MIEFQVIVLAAGKGSRITELTTRKPKCLLPIGNRPMVYYSLKKIEKSGFRGELQEAFSFLLRYVVNRVFLSRGVPGCFRNSEK